MFKRSLPNYPSRPQKSSCSFGSFYIRLNHNYYFDIRSMPTSYTIHNLDNHTVNLIRQRAKQEGLSINKTLKKLIHQSLGLEIASKKKDKINFDEFVGTWTQEEYEEFQEAVKIFDEIDEEMWK